MPKTPENIKSGTKLGIFLRTIKLSQLSLSKEMKIPASTMGRYVSGISKTPQRVVDHLYKAHKLNLDWWHTGKGSVIKDGPVQKSMITDIGLLAEKIEIMERIVAEQNNKIARLTKEVHLLSQKNRHITDTQKGNN